jgi:hypothetical protein
MKAVCPTCKSLRVKRSRSRSITERIMKSFQRKAYRCLDCGWRGILAAQAHGHASHAPRRNGSSPRRIPWLTVIIIALLVAFLLIFYITRKPSPPTSAEASLFLASAGGEYKSLYFEHETPSSLAHHRICVDHGGDRCLLDAEST